MNYYCTSKTKTETSGGKANIHCFADMNEDGSRTPTLYHAEVLQGRKEINGVSGIEGELLLVHQDRGKIGKLNNRGELTIQLNEDDATKYELQGENLVYNK